MILHGRQEAKKYPGSSPPEADATGQAEQTGIADKLVGLAKAVLDQTVRKRANLDKIIALFATDAELTNSEIRKALGVSSRTAVRYMDELEKEGKAEQIGKIGYAVTYRLK